MGKRAYKASGGWVVETDDSELTFSSTLAQERTLKHRKLTIERVIAKASREGRFSAKVDFKLQKHEKEMLSDAGYDIWENTVGEPYTSIGWAAS